MRLGVPIVEPFAGEGVVAGNRVYVAGPSREYYQHLLCDFDCAPAAKATGLTGFASYYGVGVMEAVKRKLEQWDVETLERRMLDQRGEQLEHHPAHRCRRGILDAHWRRGRAGVDPGRRLHLRGNVDYSKIKFFQVPHHGSHHSVSPTLLNRMLGPKLPAGSPFTRTAFCSSAKSAPKHPSKKVTNAFRRRGLSVHATEGSGKNHGRDNPARAGWGPSTPLPFYTEVEDD